ncbi:nicotinate-nucleotide adenylyltransferase [Marivivens sp. JLT3646]|uniref:nicotinate-nucleotide adenylyltransferase n=1 Tax=Marivivens sp. JLT3646 TaxID=1920883 RepID=UPI0007FBDDF5|nr:nicotinate-nucleotide adenylyltransferase [Marivivens sp. JLT3646]APO87737.1 nicotinic acid mononucleotide adenylyltransferase [Marivivens sp. JLT3646]OBR36317.1 nicotinic acid mononucleotide adenylyltransferase [Donghicola sp. JL3646]
MDQRFPVAQAGQVIGLLGGSFDPAHEGHAHITRVALRRFGLDRVWWLVSPGNPLKERGPAPLDLRIERARKVINDPRVIVTGIEERLGTRYTAETIAALQKRYRGVRFVWLMGADNLSQFDRWQNWEQIANSVPIGVVARPEYGVKARTSKMARTFRGAQLDPRASTVLGYYNAPAWCYVNHPLSHASSTAIRDKGEWDHGKADA